MIDADSARKLLVYNRATGKIHWSVDRRNGVRAGDPAGTPQNQGYVSIIVNRKPYLAHRLAWLLHYGQWPALMVDHINGDRSDNRLENLRLANQTQQNANSALRKDNTTGYRGVSKRVRKGRRKHYRAAICVNGTERSLGWYMTAEEAASAYSRASEAAFGEFRRFPERV